MQCGRAMIHVPAEVAGDIIRVLRIVGNLKVMITETAGSETMQNGGTTVCNNFCM